MRGHSNPTEACASTEAVARRFLQRVVHALSCFITLR